MSELDQQSRAEEKALRRRLKREAGRAAAKTANLARDEYTDSFPLGEPSWVTSRNERSLAEWWSVYDALVDGVPEFEHNDVSVWLFETTPTWFECPRCHQQWEDLPWQNGCGTCIAECHNGGNRVFAEVYDAEYARLTKGTPAQPKPTGPSQIETAISLLLKQHLPDLRQGVSIETRTVAGRTRSWEVDMFDEGLRLVVEFDGERWHDLPGSRERDRRKTDELVESGHTVIRVRTPKLGVIGHNDILVSTWTTARAIVPLVLERIKELGLV